MHHPMPCHEPKMGKPLRGPAFRKYTPLSFAQKEELVSLARYAPHVLSSLSPKRKNWSPSMRYAPPSPSDLEGNHPFATKTGSPSSLINGGHDTE